MDDLCKCLGHFLRDSLSRFPDSLDHLEIEAKFGLLVDKNTNERIQLPVLSECVVNSDGWTNFVSDMPVHFHRRFNEQLNKRFTDRALGWSYSHTRSTDLSFPDGTRLQVDDKTGQIQNAHKKKKIAHLAIHQPNYPLDIRISVSIEDPLTNFNSEMYPVSMASGRRKKDRISYLVDDGLLSIDLTQVHQLDSASQSSQLRHELELEVKRPDALLDSSEGLQQFVASLRNLCHMA